MSTFRKGDVVHHERFGDHTVIADQGVGDDQVAITCDVCSDVGGDIVSESELILVSSVGEVSE